MVAVQGSMIGREDKNGPQGSGVNEDVSFTLDAVDRHAVAYEQMPYACTTSSLQRLSPTSKVFSVFATFPSFHVGASPLWS